MSKDGGPAFPVDSEFFMGNVTRHASSGMSLRDAFALQALPECLRNCSTNQRAAEEAYSVADAMLAARAKP